MWNSNEANYFVSNLAEYECLETYCISGRTGLYSNKLVNLLGHGGCQVVSVIDFYSGNLSSNPAEAYSFFCKKCVWKEQKKARVGPFL